MPEPMIPETTSTVYDLGHHLLEVTEARTLLLAAHPADHGLVPELVLLDSDEVYKLFITLREVFQSVVE